MKSAKESLEDIIHFCKLRDENAIRRLLEDGVLINDSYENGIAPLHVASAIGAENIVKLLLLKGADVDKNTNVGWTPIMYAARNGHSKCIQQLISYGANIHHVNKFGVNVLSMAAASGNRELIEILLQGERREQESESIISPLHVTALFGHSHTLSSLLGSQFHLINKCDTHGITPLMLAVASGHEEVTKILLDFGADTNLHTSHQFTALDIASTKRYKKIIHLLANKTEKGIEQCSNGIQSTELGSDLVEQYGWSTVCTPKPRRSTWHSDTPKENMSHFPTHQISVRDSNIPSPMTEDKSSLFTPVHLSFKFPDVSVNTNLETNICSETNTTCVPVPPLSPYNCSSSLVNFSKNITPKKHHSLSSLNSYFPYQVKQRLENLKEERNSPDRSNVMFHGMKRLENWFHTIFTSWRKISKKNNTSHCQRKTIGMKENSQYCGNTHEEETSSSFQKTGRFINNNHFFSPTFSLKHLLISHKLQAYIPLFVEHEVDIDSFLMLREEDMEEIGISSPKSKSKLLEVIMNFQEDH